MAKVIVGAEAQWGAHGVLLAAIASEPLLLDGGPGAAKSYLATMFYAYFGVDEWKKRCHGEMEGESLLGPVDMQAYTQEAVHRRNLAAGLCDKPYLLLDEVDKLNKGAANALLGAFAERAIEDEGKDHHCSWRVAIAVSNGPFASEPLQDRFAACVRVEQAADTVEAVRGLASSRRIVQGSTEDELKGLQSRFREAWEAVRDNLPDAFVAEFVRACKAIAVINGQQLSGRARLTFLKLCVADAVVRGEALSAAHILPLRWSARYASQAAEVAQKVDEILGRTKGSPLAQLQGQATAEAVAEAVAQKAGF